MDASASVQIDRKARRNISRANSRREKRVKYKAKNGKEYTLIEGEVILRGGRMAKVYYFVDDAVIAQRKAQKKPLKEAKELPDDYEIVEVSKAKGHPLVQRKRRV